MKTAIVNLGPIITGDWRDPVASGDAILNESKIALQVCTAGNLRTTLCCGTW